MSNDRPKSGLRAELGDGYLSLLDSLRHSFEQAAWGQQASGNLADDFYRWASAPEATPKAMDGAELSDGVEVRPAEVEPMEGRPSDLAEREAEAVAYARHQEAGPIGTIEMDNSHDHDWREFEAWIDGRREAIGERDIAVEHERNGPSPDGPELGE